jgi:hypothetical protein
MNDPVLKVNKSVLNSIYAYLAEKPWKEVNGMIELLNANLNRHVEEAEAEKEEETNEPPEQI